jgi:hypothetical protein
LIIGEFARRNKAAYPLKERLNKGMDESGEVRCEPVRAK